MASLNGNKIFSYHDFFGVLYSFIQKSDDIYYNLDQEGNIAFINDAIQMLGYSPSEPLHFTATHYFGKLYFWSRRRPPCPLPFRSLSF